MKPSARLTTLCCMTALVSLWSLPAYAEMKITGDVEAGYQKRDVDSNEAKFEEYGQVPDGPVLPSFHIQAQGEHDTLSAEGQNVKENNQSYSAHYDHNMKVSVDASYDQTPHNYSNNATTLYTQTAPGVLSLPDSLQSSLQASQTATASSQQARVFNSSYTSFMTGAHDAGLHIQDTRSAVDLGFRSGQHMRYSLGFSEDRVEGAQPRSYALGGSFPIELPVPVDWKVYNMRAGSQYASEKAQLGFTYAMSSFNNNVDTLVWDNPKRATDLFNNGAAQGQTALAPDNWSQTISVNGGVALPAKTRFTAKGSMGYMRQNAALLPFTDNTAITSVRVSTNALPETTANAKLLTWTQDYALTNRVVAPLALGVRYHSYQLVNRTSEVTFPGRSSWDTIFTASPWTNDRFEYRKDTLEGSADWRVAKPLNVGLRYGTEWDHRTDREVTNTTEKTLTAYADVRPLSTALWRTTFVQAHRRPQDFNGSGIFEEPAEGGRSTFEEPPGLRRYDIADRLRNQGKVLLQWSPGPVQLEFNGSLTHDNFQPGQGDLLEGTTNAATMYGLLENRDATLGADVGWDALEALSFDVYYQFEQSQSLQRATKAGLTNTATNDNVQNPAYDWSVRSMDRYHVAGISARLGKPTQRVTTKLGYDIVISRGANNFVNVGRYVTPASVTGTTLVPGVLISPQDTKSSKQDISVRTTCRVTDHLSVALGYVFEKYQVSDWQYQNIPVAGGTNASQTNVFLGANLQNYTAHVGSITTKYSF